MWCSIMFINELLWSITNTAGDWISKSEGSLIIVLLVLIKVPECDNILSSYYTHKHTHLTTPVHFREYHRVVFEKE